MEKLCGLIAANLNISAPICYLRVQVTETKAGRQNLPKRKSIRCTAEYTSKQLFLQNLFIDTCNKTASIDHCISRTDQHNAGHVHVCSILKQQHCHQNKCKFFFEYDNTVAVSQNLCKYDATQLSTNEQSLYRNYFRCCTPFERNKSHSVHCSSLDTLSSLCIFV